MTKSFTLCPSLVKIKETTFLRNTIAECLVCGKHNQRIHLYSDMTYKVTFTQYALMCDHMPLQVLEEAPPKQVHLQVLGYFSFSLSL